MDGTAKGGYGSQQLDFWSGLPVTDFFFFGGRLWSICRCCRGFERRQSGII